MTDPLAPVAACAAADPFFLAFALAAYARAEGLTDATLAAHLGCPAENLTMIRLSRAPRPGDEFAADVERVAAEFGADAERLANVVRQVNVVNLMREAGPTPTTAGYLLAARDAPEEPT